MAKQRFTRPLVATYRLQLRPEFDFDAAAKIVPYLARMGISHLYLSPILEAASASTHGYDVIDHNQIATSLGGREGYDRLVEAARAHDLSLLVDIVPNHMSIADARNRWWWDVLENGPAASFARFFDVDWDPPETKLKDLVLVPILGDHRAEVLARGEIRIERDQERFFVRYFEHRLPVAPPAVGRLLADAAKRVHHPRLDFLADAYQELPHATSTDPALIERRHRDRRVLAGYLADLLADPSISVAIEETLVELNADAAMLDTFLDRQNFRLAYWRAAQRELVHRRFFDVSSLVGLRVEEQSVFDATHALYAQLLAAGKLDGLRVDHVDGLAAPAEYLERLRRLAPNAPIFVEKILTEGERLPDWPVDGTTGYDFLNDLTALFVEPRGEVLLDELMHKLVGNARPFAETAATARLEVVRDLLSAELQRLSHRLARLCEAHRDARDFTRHEIHEALLVLTASFPVYRTYVDPERNAITDRERTLITTAIEKAQQLAPNVDPKLFAFLDDLLQLRRTGPAEGEFVRHFQQFTPPAYAKGVEDTAFYRDSRLLALNEVGGDPSRFSLSLASFHQRNQEAQRDMPMRLLATSTHDTKRSEDVRARIALLSEDAPAFVEVATRFYELTRPHWQGEHERRVTMLVLQTLIGAWPLEEQRLTEYLEKALREAKLETSWTRPDAVYEERVQKFARNMLADPDIASLIGAYVDRIAGWAGRISLGWTLLKLTCPGTPDFYQGNERVRFDLVDPDNRRPLAWHEPPDPKDLLSTQKLHTIVTTLAYRQKNLALFIDGDYEPIHTNGSGRDSVIAFARRLDGSVAIPVLCRWPSRCDRDANDCVLVLPRGELVDRLTGQRWSGKVRVGELLAKFPVALLTQGGNE